MKTLAICCLAALTITGCAGSVQETRQPREVKKPYVLPQEHKEFVDEFKILLQKFPKAAERFRLADMGDQPVAKHVFVWKCEDIGDFGVDCKPVPLE